ncbi:hypothetical protein [Candidatus Lokiarchaeum ossiferum]|uniref:hypothetical protein n=1 Tax=Candidatus Lokiarchaeum ossiferum TaxID=2951803 RepID=UPI00352CCD2F
MPRIGVSDDDEYLVPYSHYPVRIFFISTIISSLIKIEWKMIVANDKIPTFHKLTGRTKNAKLENECPRS